MFKSKFALISIFLIVTILITLGFSQTAQALDRSSWEQLPYLLESRGVELKDLPVCDCPLGLNEASPSRQMLQVIGNTLYEWNEYDLNYKSGKTQLAVRMLRPENRYLTAAEARILLSASSGLLNYKVRSRAAAETLPMPTAPREGLIRGPDHSLRGATQLPDNRVKLNSSQVQTYPFNTIAYLEMTFRGSPFRGTGFLVSSRCLLTAGHNVYESDLSGNGNGYFADSVMACPAQSEAGDGVSLIRPYGQKTEAHNLQTNRDFTEDTNNLSEYDFGAVTFETPFTGIDTFMPLVFDVLPEEVRTAGYPSHPHNMDDSYDMWYDSSAVSGTRGAHGQIINFAGYVSSGNSGGPIFYLNPVTKKLSVAGIVTWEDQYYDSGVRLTNYNKDLIESWIDESLDYNYLHSNYVPYYSAGGNNWTGIALANPNEGANNIKIEFFSAAGAAAGAQTVVLPANGQKAFLCQPDADANSGWVKISSTLPLYGLSLVGSSIPSNMFDMDIKDKLHKKFIFPHLAADGEEWDSAAILCNPNASQADITCTYYPENGISPIQKNFSIPAQGSTDRDLRELFGQELNGGHLILQSKQGLAAFLLYDNSMYGQNNWKAGLSAMPMD